MKYEFKGTQGGWYVDIDGTCTGSSHRVVVDFHEIAEHETEQYEICDLESTMTNSSYDAKNFKEDPTNWEKDSRFNEVEANAHIIAASPDLLQACIAVEHRLSQYDDGKYAEVYGILKSAIHKALNIK
jgi:hypothetical protein